MQNIKKISFSTFSLCFGFILFSASLTPSLIPRNPMIQGFLSGLCFSIGYGITTFVQSCICSAGFKISKEYKTLELFKICALFFSFIFSIRTLFRAIGWQNYQRSLMQMPEIGYSNMLIVFIIALLVFVVLFAIGNIFVWVFNQISNKLLRYTPQLVSNILTLIFTLIIFWIIGNKIIISNLMNLSDNTYKTLDAKIDDKIQKPTDPYKTGGPNSYIDWETIGRQGHKMVSGKPDKQTIEQLTLLPAQEPLRVYVGLNSAETIEYRADLALKELIRIGAFQRKNLVIATPTGTGWIDPESQSALEFVLRGNVATVSVQYSYLASWLSLLADSDYGEETARTVFSKIYLYWHALPKDNRPRLYLHGLSLGALNSDLSHDLYQVINDPYHGALWSGPPFNMPTWNIVTRTRNQGSSIRLPEFQDGSVIRFTAQKNNLDKNILWGNYRIIFLQYASDGITFFEPSVLWKKPDWINDSHSPDISPDMVWIPIVSFIQLTFDMILATNSPKGFGHVYAFEHYFNAWYALTDAPEWTNESIEQFKVRKRLYDQTEGSYQ